MWETVETQANIPRVTNLEKMLRAISAKLVADLVNKFGRNVLFDDPELRNDARMDYATLVRTMEAKVGDDPRRRRTYERTRRLLTPLMEYNDIILTPNDRTLEENAAVMADIEDRLVTVILRLVGD